MQKSTYRLILFFVAFFNATIIFGTSMEHLLQSEDIKVYRIPSPKVEDNRREFVYDRQLQLKFMFRNETVVLSLQLTDDTQTDIFFYSLGAEDSYRIEDRGSNTWDPSVPRRYKGKQCYVSIICQWNSNSVYQCQFTGVFLNRGILWGIVPLAIREIRERNNNIHLRKKNGFWHRIFKLPSNNSTYLKWPRNSFTTEFHLFQNRQKRSVENTYIIELAIVLTAKVVSRLLAILPQELTHEQSIYFIKEYYTSLVRSVDLMLETLSSPKSTIGIDLTALISLNETQSASIFNAKNSYSINFNNWFNKDSNVVSDMCDFAILLTTDDVDSDGEETICTRNATGIVRETFHFKTALSIVHNIAVALGIKPDSVGNTCPTSEQFIMASTHFSVTDDTYLLNLFRFSSCSQEYVRIFLSQTIKSFCMLSKSTFSKSYKHYYLMPPGQRFTVNQQCKFHFGEESDAYQCEESNFRTRRSTFCAEIFCLNEGQCVEMTPHEGTSCDIKRWCHHGYCQKNRLAPPIPMDCWLGDKSSDYLFTDNNITCKDIAYGYETLCYDKRVRSICCWSCHFLRTTLESCLYGDRTDDCWAKECKDYSEKRVKHDCCRTCLAISASYKTNACHIRVIILATLLLNIQLI